MYALSQVKKIRVGLTKSLSAHPKPPTKSYLPWIIYEQLGTCIFTTSSLLIQTHN